jgi:adenosylcobinamide-phosphate synthase
MTLLSLILALLIEQTWPRPRLMLPVAWQATSSRLLHRLPAGSSGSAAWWLIMALGTLAAAVLHFLLWHLHPVLAFGFNVLALYLTMGYRPNLHAFTAIQVALRIGEPGRAQALLAGWRGEARQEADAQADATEVARLAIEQALVCAHRDVFGIVFWFVILPGPSGAVMYRLARELAERSRDLEPDSGVRLARRAFEFIDALPARLTALSFSVVGNFEDAIYCWRTQAVLWPDRSSGILIASGGGALGVRLGMPIHESGELRERPEMGAEGEADVDYMQSTVGLVWRALMVCLLLLAVGSIAGWVGG